MTLAQGLADTADALGMPREVLATIASYETGGTFDPRKKGPTTQWGQHEGLIQFGQPQQRQYGVDLSSQDAALNSQLGPNGAIVRYFRENGWTPEMGQDPEMALLQAYSIVNAGGPNRFGRSDANNGGAPGTVADKVRDQMSGHMDNARRLMGGLGGQQEQRQTQMPAQNALAYGQQPQQQVAPEPPKLELQDNSVKFTNSLDTAAFQAPARNQLALRSFTGN